MTWKDNLSETEFILREVKANYNNPCILWSTGKDSTAMLHIIKNLFGKIPWRVVFISTGFHSVEMLKFLDKMTLDWKIPTTLVSNLEASAIPTESREKCCNERKTQALRKTIEKYKFDAVIVSIRWDEEGIRGKERVMSPRDSQFRWLFSKEGGVEGIESLQDVELKSIYRTDWPNAHHVRVHPLLNWSELEVWEYVRDNKLPINPLYFKGYRSLGCEPCTIPVMEPSNTIDEIIDKISKQKTGERSGRSQDKELIMQRLRSLGYF